MAKARKNPKNSSDRRGGAVDLRHERRGVVELLDAEGVHARLRVMEHVEEQHAQQHQHGAEQGVEEELDGGVEPARAAPDSDQQIHRHQHGFPEDEEQEEVQRHEDAEHAGLQHQEPRVVFLDAGIDRGPGGEDCDDSEERGQHDEQERDAINAEVIAGANGGNPGIGRALHELEAGLVFYLPEPGDQRQRDREAEKGKDVGHPADQVLVLARDEHEHDGAHQRSE